MNERIKELREILHMNQKEFGKLLGITKSGVSDIENGRRNVTEQHIIMLANSKYNINEDWLRNGTGDKFKNLTNLSLDEYAKINNLSSIDIQIIIGFMNLSKDVREAIYNLFKNTFSSNDLNQQFFTISEESVTIENNNFLVDVKKNKEKIKPQEEPVGLPPEFAGKSIEELDKYADLIEDLIEKKEMLLNLQESKDKKEDLA